MKKLMQAYQARWEDALLLPGEKELVSSALHELKSYFPFIAPEEIRECFLESKELFAELWHKQKVDPRSKESLVRFYNETTLEIFELMHYHSATWDQGPLNYVCALELAKQMGCRTYLDYGSGIGSGGLLFSKEGLPATLCDISTPLLTFAQWRFSQRELQATFVDLKKADPKVSVDLITCFEVLEHVQDPLALLRKFHGLLNDGGFLVVTAPFGKDDIHPMHIVHDERLTRRFRGQGFQIRWDLKGQFRPMLHDPFFILQRVKRSRVGNSLVEAYDTLLPDEVRESLHRLVKPPARRLSC